MNTSEQHNNLLKKWIDGTLSSEEAELFEKSDAYRDYQKIINTVDQFEIPKGNQEKILEKVFKLSAKKKSRVIKLPFWIGSGIAAAAIVVLIFTLSNSKTNYTTRFGEQLSISLPDGSKVKLNADSQIEYNKRNWKSNRIVFLKGNAFFEVEKGSEFKVESKNGSIQVLGTKFTVWSEEQIFEVRCYEGSVKTVFNQNQEKLLTKGNGIRYINSSAEPLTIDVSRPEWLTDETSFQNAPLSLVLLAISKQYQVSFDQSQCDLNQRYTGSFTHQDFDKALKTVLKPLGINYLQDDKNPGNIILCQ